MDWTCPLSSYYKKTSGDLTKLLNKPCPVIDLPPPLLLLENIRLDYNQRFAIIIYLIIITIECMATLEKEGPWEEGKETLIEMIEMIANTTDIRKKKKIETNFYFRSLKLDLLSSIFQVLVLTFCPS